MMINIFEKLKLCPLFKGMDTRQIEEALRGHSYRLVNYSKFDIYALTGFCLTTADILLEGEMVCRMGTGTSKQIGIARLHAGNMVSPALLFAKDNRFPVSIESTSKVTILRMGKKEFQNILISNTLINENFIELVSNIGVLLTRKLRMLNLMTIRQKVAHFLLFLAKRQQSKRLTMDISQQEMAYILGIQKYSLQRVLAEFKGEDIIEIDHKVIIIKDMQKLRAKYNANNI